MVQQKPFESDLSEVLYVLGRSWALAWLLLFVSTSGCWNQQDRSIVHTFFLLPFFRFDDVMDRRRLFQLSIGHPSLLWPARLAKIILAECVKPLFCWACVADCVVPAKKYQLANMHAVRAACHWWISKQKISAAVRRFLPNGCNWTYLLFFLELLQRREVPSKWS